MADGKSGIRTLMLSGIIAILGTLFGGVVTGYWNARLARDKYQSDLILRAMTPSTELERLAILRFMVDANIVTDGSIREGVRSIIARAKSDSLTIAPHIRSENAQALEAPTMKTKLVIFNVNYFGGIGFLEISIYKDGKVVQQESINTSSGAMVYQLSPGIYLASLSGVAPANGMRVQCTIDNKTSEKQKFNKGPVVASMVIDVP